MQNYHSPAPYQIPKNGDYHNFEHILIVVLGRKVVDFGSQEVYMPSFL